MNKSYYKLPISHLTLLKNIIYIMEQCIMQHTVYAYKSRTPTLFRTQIILGTSQVQDNAELYRKLQITKSISHDTHGISTYTETVFPNSNFY